MKSHLPRERSAPSFSYLIPRSLLDRHSTALYLIMDESSASYIRMVQHLIEKCLLFNMNKEECMEAISKHANIMPVITSTVWKELEKENPEFFEAYAREREERVLEAETMRRVEKMLTETVAKGAADDDDDD